MVYDQTIRFLMAVGLGFFLGLGYEAFRFLRLSFPHKKGMVFAEDLLFVILAAAALNRRSTAAFRAGEKAVPAD